MAVENSNRIDSARRDQQLTYRQLARKAGISTTAAHDICRYFLSPSIQTVYGVAKALGITVEYIMSGVPEENG